MNFWELLQTEISISATTTQLYIAMSLLSIAFLLLIVQYIIFIRRTRRNNSLSQVPFNYYFAIYNGIVLIVLNELILLTAIILSDQHYTVLGREKALLQIIGYGLYMYGWTKIALFNISIQKGVKRLLNLIFLAVMIFYIFAVITTVMITFNLTFGLISTEFLGIGYELSVFIYISLLFGDLLALGVIANQKRKLSRYQAWLGLLLFISLLLQIISIVSNAIPVLIQESVSGSTHAVWNFIVEPSTYFITAPGTLLLLQWTLFNPKWLQNKFIEDDS